MARVHNPTSGDITILGVPSFAPGEVRVVSDSEADELTDRSGLVRLADDEDAPSETPKKKPRPSTATA